MESLLQGSQSGLKPRKLFLVGENEAELDELEHVDVALEGGVVVLILVVGLRRRLPYDAGELRVHGNAGVPVDELSDQGELVLQVRRPDLADLHVRLCGRQRCGHRSIRHIQELEEASGGEPIRQFRQRLGFGFAGPAGRGGRRGLADAIKGGGGSGGEP
jgi:hypothetical protein